MSEPDPRRWRILGVTLVVGFMSLLDVTIVNVALPSIQAGLGTTAATVQWIVSGYALAFGLTLVTGGRLGDAYGRRRMMLIGLTGFIVSSAAVGLAPTAWVAVAARLAQGMSAGLLTPQNSGLIQQLFSGDERGRAFGAFGFTVSVSSAIGPVLGGLIIAIFGADQGWRYLFLVNVPIGLVALVLIARMVPGRPSDDGGAQGLDLVGAALLGLMVLAVLYPLVGVIGESWWVLLLVALAPPLGWAFVAWERRVVRRGGAPLLDIALLRHTPGYGNGMAVGAIYFTGFTGVFLVLSVFFQEQLGLSALEAGLLVTPFAAGSAVAAPVAGRLVSVIGRRITLIALSTMLVGLAGVVAVAPDGTSPVWLLVPPLLVAGLGGGAVVSPNFTLTLRDVPPRMGGAAGGALQTGQRIGSAIGAALLMSVFRVGLGRGWAPQLALRVTLVSAGVLIAAALALAVLDWRRGDRPVPAGTAGG
ncbi:MFS transporter [Nocardioides sp.]|uniref:MFS transporter n=1 Tax=Nocardioides sp. TaxID=35761 RepID=UPI0035292D9C